MKSTKAKTIILILILGILTSAAAFALFTDLGIALQKTAKRVHVFAELLSTRQPFKDRNPCLDKHGKVIILKYWKKAATVLEYVSFNC